MGNIANSDLSAVAVNKYPNNMFCFVFLKITKNLNNMFCPYKEEKEATKANTFNANEFKCLSFFNVVTFLKSSNNSLH